MDICVYVDIGNGNFKVTHIQIDNETLVEMVDRYFEIKGIKIQEIGILGV